MSQSAKDVELTSHTEDRGIPGLSSGDEEFLNNLSDKTKKSAVRKVDLHLIPLLTFLYLMSYIDRTNLGNVRIEGILDDIDLGGDRYNVVQCLFFVPYCLLEVPSNWVLSRVKRPSLYLGAIVTAWGLVMTFSGFVNTYGELLLVRLLLGVTEAGFYPGALFLISRWYMPGELQMRIACFYSASAAAGAFSGLLAYGIANLTGVGGYRGWRWIFFLEGAISVAGGIACLLFLPDSPSLSSLWLKPDEVRYLEKRKLTVSSGSEVRGQEHKQSPWKTFVSVLLDWQVYLMIVIYWSNSAPNYALKFTMPQVIKNMGYTSANAQLLTIPPYALGALSAFASSWIADRFTWRMPFIVFGQIMIVISFAILYSYGGSLDEHIPECYFALMLACLGFYPILPGINAWALSNLAGPEKRSIGIAFLAALGNLGGLPGSFFFKDSEAPKYPTAYGASIGLAGLGVVACFVLEAVYRRINMGRAAREDHVRESYSPAELKWKGDRSPFFRYTL